MTPDDRRTDGGHNNCLTRDAVGEALRGSTSTTPAARTHISWSYATGNLADPTDQPCQLSGISRRRRRRRLAERCADAGDGSAIVRGADRGTSTGQICGVDRHGERGARAYNGGLEAERPPPPLPPVKTRRICISFGSDL